VSAQYYVQVIEKKTKKCVKQLGPRPERQAESLLQGVSINLNHDDFKVVLSAEPKEVVECPTK
jgi:hypothetical protein